MEKIIFFALVIPILGFVLSLEPIMEPPVRFKASAERYGFKKEDTIIYKIGEFDLLKKLLNYN